MELIFETVGGLSVARVKTDEVIVTTAQDALDLMMSAQYEGADVVLLQKAQLDPAFFDLRSGLAGDILQKFVTYDVRLLLVGPFDSDSRSLGAFMAESNRGRHIAFAENEAAARAKLESWAR